MNDWATFTTLLGRARQGDDAARARLFALVYNELKLLARTKRGRLDEPTLNSTALVHEAFLKLVGSDGMSVRDRSHFLAVAARAMRQILIDHARARRTRKRGGGVAPVSLATIEAALDGGVADFDDAGVEAILALDAALARLAKIAPRQNQVRVLASDDGRQARGAAPGVTPCRSSRETGANRLTARRRHRPSYRMTGRASAALRLTIAAVPRYGSA